ncbi:hypothetical protein H6P81_001708 [Aristolochia fimbriata]|uniref:DOG1 domain-containing protein n=1 Tax=Aristolochia fimbriata TaxID=158543 RepID=A0AAV7F7L8_ARIFI|nr:hypothetical protein H6P81_001708 [Aristolochia fimbriata]
MAMSSSQGRRSMHLRSISAILILPFSMSTTTTTTSSSPLQHSNKNLCNFDWISTRPLSSASILSFCMAPRDFFRPSEEIRAAESICQRTIGTSRQRTVRVESGDEKKDEGIGSSIVLSSVAPNGMSCPPPRGAAAQLRPLFSNFPREPHLFSLSPSLCLSLWPHARDSFIAIVVPPRDPQRGGSRLSDISVDDATPRCPCPLCLLRGTMNGVWLSQSSSPNTRAVAIMGEPDENVMNGGYNPGRERFDKFFACWIAEQDRYLDELLAASRGGDDGPRDEARLRELVSTVLRHYELYYRNKAWSAKHNVTAMFSPSWTSTLEDSLLWVGGWRPSTAFHLLYSKSGIETETQIEALLRGVAAPDLGPLSAAQLAEVDVLQRRTIKEEREISEEEAEAQETVASVGMVDLSHAVTEGTLGPDTAAEGIDAAVRSMGLGLERVLEKADELRLRTLKDLVNLLSPLQAVNFLTAAAELHLRLHDWGKQKDNSVAADDAVDAATA